MRRKFIEAKSNNKKTGKADVALNLIGKLYGIDQAIKDKSATEKYTVRQQKAKTIVDEFYSWLLKHKDKIPPKMALGKAINYAINQFEKFRRYLEDGRLKIDNNRVQRAKTVRDRPNKLAVLTYQQGTHASAIFYSLVETAKANDLMIHDYISTCLQHLVEQPGNHESLLPWNIKQAGCR